MPMKPFHRNNSPLSPRERVGVRGRLLTLSCCALLSGALPAQAEISANHWAGSVIIGLDDSPCDNSRRGAIRYESVSNYHEYCDGTQWKKFVASSSTGDPSIPPAGTGYFVLSNSTWDGNLGGLAGADAKCLSDLTGNDWLNKADAVARGLLTASNVRAFLCLHAGTCRNTTPLATYTFAVSGNNALGGASFMTYSDSTGPGNNQNWTGTNYFGGNVEYWSARDPSNGTNTDKQWGSATCCGGALDCGDWTSSSSGVSGIVGISLHTDGGRWRSSQANCNVPKRLVCMVHP